MPGLAIKRDARDRRAPYAVDDLIFDVLRRRGGAWTTYGIIAELGQHGERVVLQQAYRSLGRLIDEGRVVRVESLKAYCLAVPGAGLLICDICDECSPVEADEALGRLQAIAKRAGFQAKRSVVELRGICPNCQLSGEGEAQ